MKKLTTIPLLAALFAVLVLSIFVLGSFFNGDANHHQEHEQDHSSHAHHGGAQASSVYEQAEQPAELAADTHLDMTALFDAYHEMWVALHSDDFLAWQNAAKTFHQAGEALTWPSALAPIRDSVSEGLGHVHHVDSLADARQQFYAHSQGVIALAKQGLHSGDLYLMYCPMAFRGQGAHWLQKDDSLLNPYFGSTMLGCGDRQQVLSGQ